MFKGIMNGILVLGFLAVVPAAQATPPKIDSSSMAPKGLEDQSVSVDPTMLSWLNFSETVTNCSSLDLKQFDAEATAVDAMTWMIASSAFVLRPATQKDMIECGLSGQGLVLARVVIIGSLATAPDGSDVLLSLTYTGEAERATVFRANTKWPAGTLFPYVKRSAAPTSQEVQKPAAYNE